MGISGLTKVISDHAPGAIITNEMRNYFGRKVAIDASMSIYQFLIAVRQQDGSTLQNEEGQTTSHLMGLFYRTLRMVDNGLKPAYVFDGKPPTLKSGELAKRLARREEATKELDKAVEAGDIENFDKFSRRTVKVTAEHNAECKRLLKLLGIPYVEAPCEAEAQCAALCKAGKAFAAASEDMDTLTFGSAILLRHLTFSESRKMPINEIHLEKALQGLDMTYEQFIDLCILLGCDYCNSIKGIGPHRAVQLIKQHKNLETVLENLDKTKYPVPEDWEYKEARALFFNPEVKNPAEIELKWEAPDVEGTVQFLVKEKGFSEDRVRKGLEKLKKNLKTATQGRLDSFFKVMPNPNPNASKRKADDKTKAAPKNAKKAKSAGSGKPRR